MPDTIEFKGGALVVDALVIARELGLDELAMRRLMRGNAITSLCEAGVDDDAGRHRLTFFHDNKRLRLIVDANGQIVSRSSIDFGERPLPAALRRPGGP